MNFERVASCKNQTVSSRYIRSRGEGFLNDGFSALNPFRSKHGQLGAAQ